ncbi:FecR family protein [Zunongwangia sp.]|uniref:FecR family protein n=1 Tax=Zunongwangia sp. TaxID=1965325 RepID=UPI003AA7E789
MDKNTRFIYLLNKYLNNYCDRLEFDEFFEFLKDPYYIDYLRESELIENIKVKSHTIQLEKNLSDEMYDNILLTAKNKPKKSKNYSKSKILGLAAVFIAIVCGGIFLLYWHDFYAEDFSSNHVVLERENGEKIILDTIQSSSLVSLSGDTIQVTQGNLIRYSEKTKGKGTNTISVPFGKTFQVELIDGSLVHLNSGSTLIYPLNFSEFDHRAVELKGEAFFNITHDEQKPFIVKANGLNVQVLGTQFDINAYDENKNIAVALLEGAVKMYNRQDNLDENAKILSPGLVGNYNREDKKIQIEEINVNNYVAWRFGKLVYRNVKLKDLLTKLERHFNIRVDNQYMEIESKTINANFGDQPVEDVMKYLSEIYRFKYVITDNLVTIKEK